jgi:catechol 2,3-dioxygenase-like lactoylglutathione lyase family enzyme
VPSGRNHKSRRRIRRRNLGRAFITSNDVERSRRFYTEVLGGKIGFRFGDLTYVQLANSFIIVDVGGGPTDDKPTVILEAPSNPDRVVTSALGDLVHRTWLNQAELLQNTELDEGRSSYLTAPASRARTKLR